MLLNILLKEMKCDHILMYQGSDWCAFSVVLQRQKSNLLPGTQRSDQNTSRDYSQDKDYKIFWASQFSQQTNIICCKM